MPFRALLCSALLLTAFLASAAPAQEAERESPPLAGPLRPFAIPQAGEVRLPNGVRILVVERRTLPLVHASIILNAGALHESPEQNGLAALTGRLLVEGGAGDLTGAEFAEQVAALGAGIGSSASLSWAQVQVTSLSSAFAEAFGLAALAVRAPRFEEREFKRVRGQSIAGYQQVMSNAAGIANRISSRVMFEPAAPYARNPGGSAATLQSLSLHDVTSWHQRLYAPANTTVLLVGDISLEEARSLVAQHLGAWHAPAPRITLPANPLQRHERTRVILVDRPGSVQSALWVGVPAIPVAHPDYFPMTVLDRVLGGGFTSRINLNLRERHGFTYGANTSLWALQNAGVFYASSAVRTTATDSALAEVVRELRGIATTPVSQVELDDAVENLVAGLPASMQTIQQVAGRLLTLIIYDQPLDYYNGYRERLRAVGTDDVSQVAQRWLGAAPLTMIVVGDLQQIEAPIRAREFGDVEVWDAEGQRLR